MYWEDSYTQWRFDRLPEALEAMRDPFFCALTPEESRPRSSLREVQEFPAYSTHLGTALTVVEHLSSEEAPLALWRTLGRWAAAFSGSRERGSDRAPRHLPRSVAQPGRRGGI